MTDYTDPYLNRLLYQFDGSENLQAVVQALLDECEALTDVNEQLLTLRYLDTATGVQLDGIGDIVGVDRPLDYDDDQYLFLIKVKILTNSTDMMSPNMIDLMAFVFSEADSIYYELTTNLSPRFTVYGDISDEAKAAFSLVPNTLGIDLVVSWSPDPATLFSFYEDSTGLGFGDLNYPDVGGYFNILI